MGRATSVKENTSFSGPVNGSAVCLGSITCAYRRAGGKVANFICCALGSTCPPAGGCGCGASIKDEPGKDETGKDETSEDDTGSALGVPAGDCAKPALQHVMVRRRPRRQWGKRDFVKKTLPDSRFVTS
jgi:hypothetical protein